MKRRTVWFAVTAIVSFGSGAFSMLALACLSSGHWASLEYVYKAYELRLDGGEAADKQDWRSVDRSFSAVLKVKGTEADNWPWYFPLIGWTHLDYTQGPGLSYQTDDLEIAAYAASRSGDEARASAIYGKLEKISPGTARNAWDALALRSLAHFADAADISRRGKAPRMASDPVLNPPAPQ
ncbi:hypothetical protein J2X57_003744 [Luteibacter sp. 1214]|uniref:hypothetical protein n=1 Tax=Luteibacter sp. 1214 TaxID=2817735 RepID=UPI0028577B3D|nr:hypothetical protein [Luteibacter sp. 1214]MDR6644501.1 hypothetical protein [Luteibacter sp. 1214]